MREIENHSNENGLIELNEFIKSISKCAVYTAYSNNGCIEFLDNLGF